MLTRAHLRSQGVGGLRCPPCCTIVGNSNCRRPRVCCLINCCSCNSKILSGTCPVRIDVRFTLDEVRLQVTLRVSLSIATSFRDSDFVIGLVILSICTSSSVEPDELISGCTSLNLDDDWMVIRIITEIGNAY